LKVQRRTAAGVGAGLAGKFRLKEEETMTTIHTPFQPISATIEANVIDEAELAAIAFLAP